VLLSVSLAHISSIVKARGENTKAVQSELRRIVEGFGGRFDGISDGF
jgi:hypothetical protein